MRHVSDTEVELITEIERLELDIRETRWRLDRAEAEKDRSVLARQLQELEQRVEYLRRELKQS